MAIDLKKYLTEQYQRSIELDKSPGPVITISRQYGCAAKDLAQKLSERLNEIKTTSKTNKDWTWINKEVFEGTAKALNLRESRILHVFEGEKKGLVEGIILSSSEKYYASDNKIRKKIIEIVRSFAEQGNIIVIGLASSLITRDIKKSLHIRLEAPFKWRVEQLTKKWNRPSEEMEKDAENIDKKRDKFRDSFLMKTDAADMFDVTFNSKTVALEEIVDTIICMMKKREMI